MENKKSTRKLKLFNGRSHGTKYRRHHIYIAATSMKEAAKLVGLACYGEGCENMISVNEIRTYYNKGCWGNAMEGIIPTEPCVYIAGEYPETKPFRVI